jgi:hypothetical protein
VRRSLLLFRHARQDRVALGYQHDRDATHLFRSSAPGTGQVVIHLVDENPPHIRKAAHGLGRQDTRKQARQESSSLSAALLLRVMPVYVFQTPARARLADGDSHPCSYRPHRISACFGTLTFGHQNDQAAARD